jgi:hypothetical protein
MSDYRDRYLTHPEPVEIFQDAEDTRKVGNSHNQYQCIDCHDFTGGPLAAFEHHRQHHHRIQIVALKQLARFGCCAMHDPAPDDLLIEDGADFHVGFPERTTE